MSLAILGIGEDGLGGLSPPARALLADADLVIGGRRHLALAAPLIVGEQRPWPSPIEHAIPIILACPGPVVALASGDPFCFGVGPMLAAAVPGWHCIPAASSPSLACARLGWAMQEVALVSFCGRPLAPLAPLLHRGARILALSADATTPAAVAAFLCAHGFGASRLTLLEALGGPRARQRTVTAEAFDLGDIDPLNLVAIEAEAGPDARPRSLVPGRDDAEFAHDGQLTKREIRAVTLAALAPEPGELLWDVGHGSGAVGIEWMLAHPANRAIGIERRPDRAARARENAGRLGVPGLRVVEGEAPASLAGLPPPDAVFVGGGLRGAGLVEAAWSALRPQGRLVANAVTLEGEVALAAAQQRFGGDLTRLSVARMEAVGGLRGFRPAMTVTQWVVRR